VLLRCQEGEGGGFFRTVCGGKDTGISRMSDEIAHVYCRPSHDMSALVSFAGQYSDGDHCEVIYSHSKL